MQGDLERPILTRMNESGAGSGRLTNALTVVVCAAAVAIPWWMDRALDRWWDENRPLLPFGTRYQRMQARYRARQDSLAEGAVFVAAVVGAVAVSLPPPRRSPR